MSKHEKGMTPRYEMLSEEKEIVKSELIIRSGGHCEHPEGCNETNIDKLTIDHFTPQCIAKIWGWTPEEVNDLSNLLLLCKTHHQIKDARTEQLKQENALEFSVFKRWAVEQRKKQEQSALILAEELVA